MAQYVSRFIPDYATITTPLRLLTRQDTPWKWEQEEQKALDKLKEALVGDQVMSYFDPRKKTEIIVDASPTGLGGLLLQEGKVLGYASRTFPKYTVLLSITCTTLDVSGNTFQRMQLQLLSTPFLAAELTTVTVSNIVCLSTN